MLGLKFLDGCYPLTLEQELEQCSFLPVRGVSTAVRKQLLEYFAGERHHFDLPLALRGSAFQITVWQALTRIPFGETCSYGQLAVASGYPGA
ncbi:MAG: MGMT family protein, partial [Gemmatimonadaceae bacterium]|nr:MGMT family protein [Gloeobacterales cyanobacterium ES-bin-141]